LLRIPFFWSKPVMQLRFYLHFHICPSCPDIQKILFSINDCCFTVSLSFYLHSDFLCSISFYFFHKSQVTLFRSISCFPLEVVFHFVVEEKRGCSVNFRTKCEGFVKSRWSLTQRCMVRWCQSLCQRLTDNIGCTVSFWWHRACHRWARLWPIICMKHLFLVILHSLLWWNWLN
jgi:hypothetical protein